MPAPRMRRATSAVGIVLAALLFSACENQSPFGADQAPPTVLVASPAFTEGNLDAQARLGSLRRTLEALRSTTSSGWTGRQDDVTGFLAELSGGRYTGGNGTDVESTIQAFMVSYGLDLFGVSAESVRVGEPSGEVVTGVSTIRAEQQLNGLPVLDGQLVFTVNEDAAVFTAVRGRVFPDLEASTTPGVGPARAARTAVRLTGGERQGRPRLVVLPEGAGRLVWEVLILGADPTEGLALADGRYFIDAQTADLVTVRATSAESAGTVALSGSRIRRVATAAAAAAADPNSVDIAGQTLFGGELSAVGIRTPDGVALVDTTVPTYDDATGEGALITYTAQDTKNLPGRLYVERRQNGTTITDPEALAAHRYSRAVYDYYASLGRSSWDGAGGTLLSTVNYGDSSFCNSFFNGQQMIYGNPCADPDGPAELTEVDVDTAGHEITHGVINTSAGLVYSGQSGALNESFADYFGNVIGNAFNGTDSAAVFEGSCTGIEAETSMCHPNPEGFSLRYLLNGSTFDDYLRLLNPTFRYNQLTGYDADNGGVHLNSAIWNNALWSIRSRLAQIDGGSGNDSELATDFDKIVYAALTTQITPGSGFFAARAAVERTAVDAGAAPVIVETAREVFDLNRICEGCADVGTVNGSVVSNAPQTQIEPSVSGDRIGWVDLSEGNPGIGLPATSRGDGTASSLAAVAETTQVVFAGDATVTLDLPGLGNDGRIVRYGDDGSSTVLAETGFATVLSGLAGSDAGAAWAANDAGTISFVDAEGEVTTADLPSLGGDTVVSLGTAAGNVAFGTEQGRVVLWQPGGDFVQIGQTTGAVFSVATDGSRVFAVDSDQSATLFSRGGSAIQVSSSAGGFGAAMNGDYAVWSQAVGNLGGQIAEELGGVTDTDLYLYSLKTGTIYNLLAQTGQQGYPAISGDRVVWQDTVLGGNNIFTATLPPGL